MAPLMSPLSSEAIIVVGTVSMPRNAGVPNSPKDRRNTMKKLSRTLGLRSFESMWRKEALPLKPRVFDTSV